VALEALVLLRTGFFSLWYLEETLGRKSTRKGYASRSSPSFVLFDRLTISSLSISQIYI